MGRLYLFAYYQSLRDLRLDTRPMESQIHKVRDGLASGALFELLIAGGYRYGGTILNLPSQVATELDASGKLRTTTENLRSSDLILLATRPPLDDKPEEGNKRKLFRSGHALETDVLNSLRSVFQQCDRETIRLSDSIRLVENSWMREVHFYQSKGGTVRYFNVGGNRQSSRNKNLTVGYVTWIPRIKKGMPRLLAVFGSGGTETLLLSYLLRNDYKLFSALRRMMSSKQARVLVCTFEVPPSIPYPFLNYDLHQLNPTICIDQAMVI
jgi:hypothetical protein